MGKKISRGIGILFKVRHMHFATNDILNQLYCSLVYPFLTYGLIAWGNNHATTLNSVVVLKKKAVPIITYSNRNPYSSSLCPQLGLIKLVDLVTIYVVLCYLN